MSKKQKSFPYHLHVSRALLAALCLLAIGILHAPPSLLPIQRVASSAPQVLAYATNINRPDLTAQTNAARSANGLGALSENAQLNVAAQLKANDMIANNYWAHTSPTGVEPWYWFTSAGYDYTKAGENLAYGFSSSDTTVTAWMNSPGHRANILGSFKDVGHGIANGENYQGNQNTVVVAHYGTPRTTPPVVTPAPAAPVAPSTPTPNAPVAATIPVQQPAAPSPVEAQAPAASSDPIKNPEVQKETPATPVSPMNTSATPVTAAPTKSSPPVWQQLLSGQAPLLVIVSLSILVVVGAGYVATHMSLVRRAAIMGEQYVLHHPVFDATFMIASVAIVMLSTIHRF